MDEDISVRVRNYCATHEVTAMWLLGDGMQGNVFNCEYQGKFGSSAVKFFLRHDDFEKELAVYQLFKRKAVQNICGLSVPQLIAWDSVSRH